MKGQAALWHRIIHMHGMVLGENRHKLPLKNRSQGRQTGDGIG